MVAVDSIGALSIVLAWPQQTTLVYVCVTRPPSISWQTIAGEVTSIVPAGGTTEAWCGRTFVDVSFAVVSSVTCETATGVRSSLYLQTFPSIVTRSPVTLGNVHLTVDPCPVGSTDTHVAAGCVNTHTPVNTWRVCSALVYIAVTERVQPAWGADTGKASRVKFLHTGGAIETGCSDTAEQIVLTETSTV